MSLSLYISSWQTYSVWYFYQKENILSPLLKKLPPDAFFSGQIMMTCHIHPVNLKLLLWPQLTTTRIGL